MRRHAAVMSAVCTLAFSFALPVFAQAPAAVSAKIWTDRAPEIEAYLKTAEVVGMEDLKVGVTKPRRAKLAHQFPPRLPKLPHGPRVAPARSPSSVRHPQ